MLVCCDGEEVRLHDCSRCSEERTHTHTHTHIYMYMAESRLIVMEPFSVPVTKRS